MKVVNFNKKLSLNKETVTRLNPEDLDETRGGGATKPPTRCDCYSADTNCPTKVMVVCTTY